MSFDSALFLVFFTLVAFFYFIVPHRFRWVVLLAASCYFYMCFIPAYLLVLLGIILVDFCAALGMEKFTGIARKIFFGLSLVGNLGALFIFKYFNFFESIVFSVASFFHIPYFTTNLGLILPLGLSFHALQSISYAIEVYTGRQQAERHLGIFALYVLFFPQLVAGPIERPQHMLPQFKTKHMFDLDRLASGLRVMTWGFFLKVVVADRLAFFVKPVFETPAQFIGPSFIIAILFFAFQIYADFAGYSYIALGAARVLGFDLVQNFNRPYIAQSISEFWRRWHISLSSWLRDYVYIPLGGNHGTRAKVIRNIVITFVLSGLWHGAAWTFVCWGVINALYLILFPESTVPKITRQSRRNNSLLSSKWTKVRNIIGTFVLVCIGWVFFRAASIADALYILIHTLAGWGALIKDFYQPGFVQQMLFLYQSQIDFFIACSAIGAVLGLEWWMARQRAAGKILFAPRWRNFLWIGLIVAIFFFGEFRAQTFIYFQF